MGRGRASADGLLYGAARLSKTRPISEELLEEADLGDLEACLELIAYHRDSLAEERLRSIYQMIAVSLIDKAVKERPQCLAPTPEAFAAWKELIATVPGEVFAEARSLNQVKTAYERLDPALIAYRLSEKKVTGPWLDVMAEDPSRLPGLPDTEARLIFADPINEQDPSPWQEAFHRGISGPCQMTIDRLVKKLDLAPVNAEVFCDQSDQLHISLGGEDLLCEREIPAEPVYIRRWSLGRRCQRCYSKLMDHWTSGQRHCSEEVISAHFWQAMREVEDWEEMTSKRAYSNWLERAVDKACETATAWELGARGLPQPDQELLQRLSREDGASLRSYRGSLEEKIGR